MHTKEGGEAMYITYEEIEDEFEGWEEVTPLDILCEVWDIEKNKEWYASDGNKYRIDNRGVLWIFDEDRGWWDRSPLISEFLIGRIQPIWIPKKGDVVYIPCFLETNFVDWNYWDGGTTIEMDLWDKGLVFRTEREAHKAACKMIEKLQEE